MKRILVADDEPSIRKLYERELIREGYEVHFASNGQEAVQLSARVHPDLIVMDIRMPGMDGIESMRRIMEEDNQIPIVINTAYTSYKDNFLCWSADAYVTKSSDLTELKAAIRGLLEGERSAQNA